MNYKLEIKHIVDYPRCRIYRDFIRTLMKDKSIRTTGSSYLFYYIVLCSFANYRASYRKLEGISYLIGPGEWVCRTTELRNHSSNRSQSWIKCVPWSDKKLKYWVSYSHKYVLFASIMLYYVILKFKVFIISFVSSLQRNASST